MKRWLFLLVLLLAHPAPAQESGAMPEEEKHGLLRLESARYALLREASSVSAESRIDVSFYRLNVHITTSPALLRGVVTMRATSLVPSVSAITLDLMSAMVIDSVHSGGLSCAFTQHPSTFDVVLDRAYGLNEVLEVEIAYHGLPGSSGFGSFEFSQHGSPATPWVWSLSEPFGAKDWWPCKDHPADKADSVDVNVTVADQFSVGSNGKLAGIDLNGDGTATYHWQERYPISTYLVSVALTNYAHFSNWFRYTPTDSMEVLNYVLPEHLASAQSGLPLALDGLRIYSDLFGLYPFITEKYGHSEFGWGGGMEHQTMTSLGGFSEGLVMHELAHQWFGDMITCRTWPDIWLNEGFATYCEMLYVEKKYGAGTYWSRINSAMTDARNAVGTISVIDSGATLFSWNLVYAKGAVVLHMLRHMMGDSAFFGAMRDYANDPALKYGTAATADFQAACESRSGLDLGYFFDEWIFGEKYPRYAFGWSSSPGGGGWVVHLTITQTTGTVNPGFFTMPVDVRISGSGWDTTVVVFNDSLTQTFDIPVSHSPVTVQLDPDNWILKGAFSPFASSRASIPFGGVVLGFSRTDSLTVTNATAAPMTIGSVLPTDTDLAVQPATAVIPAFGGRKFYVTYTPTRTGAMAASIAFHHDLGGSPGIVSVSGTGLPQSVQASYASGWNLVSVPVLAADPRAGVLFPGGSSAFRYDGDAYQIADTLRHGIGYWVKFGSSRTLTLTGPFLLTDTVELTAGWNLVGSVSTPVAVARLSTSPPGIITSRVFRYQHAYAVAETLKPGEGYWIKAASAGELFVSPTGAAHPAPSSYAEAPPPPPADDAGGTPSSFALGQNYPNPFNPETEIVYDLPWETWVEVAVFDLLGRHVATLVEERQAAGTKVTRWNAAAHPAGVYYCRLRTPLFTETRKMLLLR